MTDHFFTVTHLDGSTRTYDYAGRPAYLGFHRNDNLVQHIDIRPEPTQASGCAAANEAWNKGGQQAWLDLNIQAHVKGPVYAYPQPGSFPKFDVPCTDGSVFCRVCGVRHNHTFTCPTCGSTVDVRTE